MEISAPYADYTADSDDSILLTPVALCGGLQDTEPPSKDATLGWERGGSGGAGGAPPRPQARHTAQRRQWGGGRGSRSPLASHLQLRFQTCSSPPLASPPGPARPPFCLLSPAVLDGPSPFPGAGHLVQIRAGGVGAGGCGGAAGPPAGGVAGGGPSLSAFVAGSRPALALLPAARAAGRTLRRVGRCLCARGRARGGGGGGGEAGGQGPRRPRPDMAEVSIDQSKLPGVKEGRSRGVKRARGPSPPAARVPCGQGRRPLGPRGPRLAPTWCRPALAGKGVEF